MANYERQYHACGNCAAEGEGAPYDVSKVVGVRILLLAIANFYTVKSALYNIQPRAADGNINRM